MTQPGQPVPPPGGDLGVALAALQRHAAASTAALTGAELAGDLRAQEHLQAVLTAGRAATLTQFRRSGGFEADGSGSAKSWLRWQTGVTHGAAAVLAGWAKRLEAHPQVAVALATLKVTESYARKICDLSDRLPEDKRADADQILVAAAAGGALVADLEALTAEMLARCAPPDTDDGDGFEDRGLWATRLFRGHGKLDGDLTPQCLSMLEEVLASLGKKAGPEDDRTRAQRDHDAFEDALRLALGAEKLPDRAGQPAMVQLHMNLDQLPLPGTERAGDGMQPGGDVLGDQQPAAGADGAAGELPEWLTGPAPAGQPGEPGWLTGAAAEAYSCDAKIAPVVCGHLDRDALAAMVHAYLHGDDTDGDGGPDRVSDTQDGEGDGLDGEGAACTCTARDRRASARARRDPGGRLADALTRYAISVLSGPTGLAAFLRSGLTSGFTRSASLPLDVGTATEEVPPHLRRAVINRDRHCAFPGCDRRPVLCQVHHVVPRAKGGPTRLDNLILLCSFHHLIAVHRWGWTITLHGDGTTTAVSPDGTKIFHSHGPPGHDPPGHDPPASAA